MDDHALSLSDGAGRAGSPPASSVGWIRVITLWTAACVTALSAWCRSSSRVHSALLAGKAVMLTLTT